MTAAICMTFDDMFVANWLQAKPLFREYQARVTFCVCMIQKLDYEQLQGLKALQDDGHEISYHTRTHPNLARYLNDYGLISWCRQELDRGIAEHHAAGFPARSIGSPFHKTTADTREETVKRFAVTRDSGPFGKISADFKTRIYTKPQSVVDCLGSLDFNRQGHLGWDWFDTLMDAIAEKQGAGVFVGHDIRVKKTDSALYSTLEDLERVLDAAKSRGIMHKTLADLNPGFPGSSVPIHEIFVNKAQPVGRTARGEDQP